MFRKAKALGEQGFFEKASKILEDLRSKSPAGLFIHPTHERSVNLILVVDAASASAELARLKAIDDERERAHKHKMKGNSIIPTTTSSGSTNTSFCFIKVSLTRRRRINPPRTEGLRMQER